MLYCLEPSYFAFALTHHALMLYFISTLRIRSLDIASCSYADANILSSLFMFNSRGAFVVELNSNVGVYQQCVYPFGNPFAQLGLPHNPLSTTTMASSSYSKYCIPLNRSILVFFPTCPVQQSETLDTSKEVVRTVVQVTTKQAKYVRQVVLHERFSS